jgi:trafficking protein particle complex subunit 11
MDAFPEDFVAHNLPLILLSGIGTDDTPLEPPKHSRNLLQEGGFRIRTDTPPLTNPVAEDLLQAFLTFNARGDGFNRSWRVSPGAFKIKRVGRVG